MANFFVVVGKFLEEQYAAHLSDFTSWGQKEHASDYVLFPENKGEKLSFKARAIQLLPIRQLKGK